MPPLPRKQEEHDGRSCRQDGEGNMEQVKESTLNPKVSEWEIWHTYSTYLRTTNIDLEVVARRLVESGIALCAVLRDGKTFWSSGTQLGSGITEVRLDPYETRATINFNPDAGCEVKLDGFALEAWNQASRFRFGEQRVLGKEGGLPPPYLRAYLGQCNLVSEPDSKSKVRLYPVLLIYESGVVLLELRTISPAAPQRLSDFISNAVNLFRHPFEQLEVSPGIVRLATRAYYHSYRGWTLPYRLALIWLERGHDKAVRQLARSHEEGDFSFDLAPLSSAKGGVQYENLSTFALTVFHTVAFVIGQPRLGLAFLLWGQKKTPALGGFWSGRPHVYLVRFERQCETASENERRFGAAFGSILLRVFSKDAAVARSALPEDSRLFEDFNSYITSAVTLWVWSKKGLRGQKAWADPNRGHLIYEHQAIVELLEYGYMLHRSLLEHAEGYDNATEVFAAQRALLKLQQQMSEASHSGEIRNLLSRGWSALNLPELRNLIQGALSLRKAETSAAEARTTTRLGQALTVLFGLVAVPSLAEQVIQPLWQLIEIPYPTDLAMFKTIANIISICGVGLIVFILMRRLGLRQ